MPAGCAGRTFGGDARRSPPRRPGSRAPRRARSLRHGGAAHPPRARTEPGRGGASPLGEPLRVRFAGPGGGDRGQGRAWRFQRPLLSGARRRRRLVPLRARAVRRRPLRAAGRRSQLGPAGGGGARSPCARPPAPRLAERADRLAVGQRRRVRPAARQRSRAADPRAPRAPGVARGGRQRRAARLPERRRIRLPVPGDSRGARPRRARGGGPRAPLSHRRGTSRSHPSARPAVHLRQRGARRLWARSSGRPGCVGRRSPALRRARRARRGRQRARGATRARLRRRLGRLRGSLGLEREQRPTRLLSGPARLGRRGDPRRRRAHDLRPRPADLLRPRRLALPSGRSPPRVPPHGSRGDRRGAGAARVGRRGGAAPDSPGAGARRGGRERLLLQLRRRHEPVGCARPDRVRLPRGGAPVAPRPSR